MPTIASFPYFEIQFNKEGRVHDEAEVKSLLEFLDGDPVTDLFVISHGWNNNLADARGLYNAFFTQLRAQLDKKRIANLEGKKFGIVGILWPSMKFEDAALIASGAASAGGEDVADEALKEQLESLKGLFDNPDADTRIDQAKRLVEAGSTNEAAASQFVDLVRSLPLKDDVHADDGSEDFFSLPATEIVDILRRPDGLTGSAPGEGGAAGFNNEGGAAGLNIFGDLRSALRNVLNYTTYFQIKERAGIVGRTGAYSALSRVREKHPGLRFHFVGHSFGGRLVTALADGPSGQPPLQPSSMTLVQAAFSHNGFAQRFDGSRDGFFRKIVTERKVSGPILITHSERDSAVGFGYPIASKLSRSDASGLGDKNDRFGGIGRNGAQFTPEAVNSVPLGPETTSYHFEAGKLYNLNADTVILDHSDIIKKELAHAILSAVAAG